MAVIKKKGNKSLPPISTASLPDVIFMILFFFMVSTTMRDQELHVKYQVPEATEVQKLEKKSLVSYILDDDLSEGRPIYDYGPYHGDQAGTSPRECPENFLRGCENPGILISGRIHSRRGCVKLRNLAHPLSGM